jgi:hypothetical protein
MRKMNGFNSSPVAHPAGELARISISDKVTNEVGGAYYYSGHVI